MIKFIPLKPFIKGLRKCDPEIEKRNRSSILRECNIKRRTVSKVLSGTTKCGSRKYKSYIEDESDTDVVSK